MSEASVALVVPKVAPVSAARPIPLRASFGKRFRTMAALGYRMMFYDKSKLFGTLIGVVFAVVLSNQQLGTFLGLLAKNTMFVDRVGADLWLAPQATESLVAGKTIHINALMQARTTKGVAWAEPLLFTAASFALPAGGTEVAQLVGVTLPGCRGGPWNLVAGDCGALGRPDSVIVEDAERQNLGGLNLGSVREVSGRNLTVVGFSWGLLPFGPSYAFTNFETVREMAHVPADQASFVLIGLAPGADAAAVKRALLEKAPEAKVMTQKEFNHSIIKEVLTRTAIGVTFGTSTLFGLIVGLVIVGLSMFSAVVDNVREFGTLKAIGCTNWDLACLLFVQSVLYGVLGSLVGLTLVTRIALGIRSAKLALMLPAWLTLGTVLAMVLLCSFASLLALLRVRKVEPAMVFR
jgi:putative ABC transport system permease protein